MLSSSSPDAQEHWDRPQYEPTEEQLAQICRAAGLHDGHVITIEDRVNVLISPLTDRALLVNNAVLPGNDLSHLKAIAHVQHRPIGVKLFDQFGIATQLGELTAPPRHVPRDPGEAGTVVWHCEQKEFVYPKISALLDLFDQVFPRDQAAQTMANTAIDL